MACPGKIGPASAIEWKTSQRRPCDCLRSKALRVHRQWAALEAEPCLPSSPECKDCGAKETRRTSTGQVVSHAAVIVNSLPTRLPGGGQQKQICSLKREYCTITGRWETRNLNVSNRRDLIEVGRKALHILQ